MTISDTSDTNDANNINKNNKIDDSIDFIMALGALKGVYRKTAVKTDNNRKENSAEHSWHASLLAYALSDYIDIDADINKVMRMLLIHDVVEMYAGDLFAFVDEQQKAQQKQDEYDAIEKLYRTFPLEKVSELKALWIEFEEGETAEAQFALSMDRLLPFLQNMNNNGGSWAEFSVTKTQILARNAALENISSSLWQYLNQALNKAIANGWVVDELA